MNSYELSRKFIDFSFENPSKIKPNHYALYFFSIEHCNRLGWKKEFGLPTTMTMEAIGIKSYNTYMKTFNELIDFGFFKIVERSKNQYSSNIIELSNFDKALDKALDKAFIKHATKHCESTQQSIDSINKPIYKETNTTTKEAEVDFFKVDEWIKEIGKSDIFLEGLYRTHKLYKGSISELLNNFKEHLKIYPKLHNNFSDFKKHFASWLNIKSNKKELGKYQKQSKGQL